MRYILLFLIAILLPIFAFLNFSYDTDTSGKKIGSDAEPENQTASLNFSEVSNDTNFSDGAESESDEGGDNSDKIDSGIAKPADNEPVKPDEDAVSTSKKMDGSEIATSISEYVNRIFNSISGTDPGVVESSSEIRHILPSATYASPSAFPETSTSVQPYLERLKNPSFVPLRNWDVDFEDIDGEALLVIEPGSQKVLYNKNIFESRPIASLTKLITALVVIGELDLKDEVTISKNAVDAYGEMGGLVVDEKLTVENLLYIMLISSSNDAAVALEEYYNSLRTDENSTFVWAMNRMAQELRLFDSVFVEPTGIDENNISTAYDLARLADHAFAIPMLRQIMSTAIIDVMSLDGKIAHRIVNSNKLLGVIPGVLGGKTGYTEEAGESIVLFVKKLDLSQADDYLIYVILGSMDRTKSSRHLIDWMGNAYVWE